MPVFNKISKFIEHKGISRYRFWQDTQLGRDTAYRLCNDPFYIPTGNVLDKICSTYKIQPGEILGWYDESETSELTAESSQEIQLKQNKKQKEDIDNEKEKSKLIAINAVFSEPKAS
ncbi:helix-turn-helix domain-containing protein [Gloeothece citriformis]|uniref:helix-turn-helix domain-containing protein n=1 Tax=Gloeothece citriformis TaxID=2546356 RepID=UPI000675FECC